MTKFKENRTMRKWKIHFFECGTSGWKNYYRQIWLPAFSSEAFKYIKKVTRLLAINRHFPNCPQNEHLCKINTINTLRTYNRLRESKNDSLIPNNDSFSFYLHLYCYVLSFAGCSGKCDFVNELVRFVLGNHSYKKEAPLLGILNNQNWFLMNVWCWWG